MKKGILYGLVILLIIVGVAAVFLKGSFQQDPVIEDGTTEKESEVDKETETDESIDTSESDSEQKEEKKTSDSTKDKTDESSEQNTVQEDTKLSKFNYLPIKDNILHRAVMVSIENTPRARPQAGLNEAPIVYEFLVEGGITRFLALYWANIPEKIGPIRSLRPYMIDIAKEYEALLLHAGASPDGFEILQKNNIPSLDQIFNGKYYWRSDQKPSPHNLYTSEYRISEHLNEMLGVEYENRFNFEEIMIISNVKEKAEVIDIDYWGNYKVIYEYNSEDNSYLRFLNNEKNPHYGENGNQIKVKNIIVQFVKTKVKDDVGRLSMEVTGENKALYFRNGLVNEGHWEKTENGFTEFYNNENKHIKVNPGNTWIQVVPTNIKVSYKESE
ncbi:MAG: DUF3048 domain-containing protein [Bacillota bacterium]